MLLDSPKIYAIESNFISLFDRTFKKGIKGQSGPKLKKSVKTAFSSKTFEKQIDSLIDDIYLYTIDFTDKLIQKSLKAGLQRSPTKRHLSAAEGDTSTEPLILTEEAVKECSGLADEVVESIIRTLKDEEIYQEHPRVLARKILDLWGGERYRAVRWARTFSADVATNTSLYQFKQQGIEECQFYARIDGKTSPQCRTLHGLVMKTNSSEARKFRPPLHHHCLVAGTKINTFEGEQNIEDIKKGTTVLTHLNNYMPVYDTMVREAEDILEISTENRTIKITANHPVLTKRNNKVSWILAGELIEEDEIVVV